MKESGVVMRRVDGIEISGIALFKEVWLFLWCVCAGLSSEEDVDR